VLISIIITIKNEEKTIGSLLDSLVIQEKPFEIIVVDAYSSDDTEKIISGYSKKYPEICFYKKKGSRGEGRNYGVSKANGQVIAFTDGGCVADKNWLKHLRKKINEGFDVVAGNTIDTGYFEDVKRVNIFYKGYDITYPSCNLCYKKVLFDKIKGFDPRFITAEDIDLNFRAVDAGGKIAFTKHAIIYRKSAQNLLQLIKQAYWYGYGRKQLSLKHGRLWSKYAPQQTLKTHFNLKSLIRLFFGFFGYLKCKFSGGMIR